MLLKLSPIRLSSRSLHVTRTPLRVPLRLNSRGFWKRISRSGRLSSRQSGSKSTRSFIGAGSNHPRLTRLISGEGRTSPERERMSAFDPTRTSADTDFYAVLGEDLWPLGHADRLVKSYASGPTEPSNVGL